MSSPSVPSSGRLIVVSNRLPVSLKIDGKGIAAHPSSGGLQSALAGIQRSEGFTWVGWPGTAVAADRQQEVRELLARGGCVPVFVSETQERHYYHGISNGAIWPLFHYFTDRVEFSEASWEHYVQVNRAFAQAILAVAGPGDRVWVHDFHLMLVPQMLREKAPGLEIGFFLHIPFPSSEIYRILPKRAEVLRGLLGADHIGFHTHDYARHFRSACLRVLGIESDPAGIEHEGRRIGVGVHPIGIEVEHFRALMKKPETLRHYRELEQRYAGRKLILGVERLDYTKGVPQKLAAFERLLQRDPARASELAMLQVLVPSRLQNPDYAALKREIEERIGRLNGEYGKPGITPVEYMHRNLSPEQLVALYMFADVGYVAPLRDGMNLVAQEFALCQEAAKGTLVLSELAGAAHVLSGALLVNPYDTEGSTDALEDALALTPEERRQRMQPMIERVVAMDSQSWASGFLARQHESAARNRAAAPSTLVRQDDADRLAVAFHTAHKRVLLLDYDGTLREFCKTPDEAKPTEEITTLLAELAALPDTEVHIVSGRKSENLQNWFAALPLRLAAEHGWLVREPGWDWRPLSRVDLSWMPRVEQQLEQIAKEVPGSFVERKSVALAWHYRAADPDYGAWRARELVSHLQEDLGGSDVQVIHGHKVVEARAIGVNKGAYVKRALEDVDADTFVLCIGDDRTDEDMYAALPESAIAIHVGQSGDGVRYSLESPARVRALLRSLLETMKVASPA